MGDATAPHRRPDDDALAAHLVRLPQRQVLGEDVYEAVKALIMDHVIAPGERMGIDGLARALQVSQTPIREALARLESDGLVTKAPLRGYSATPLLTRPELQDLFGLRELIEPWAAARAAERADDETRAALEAELAVVPAAPAGSGYEEYAALAAHDARFHDLLLRAAGNEAVRQAFERTHCHLHVFRISYGTPMGDQALREHRAIVDAVVSGHARAAEAAMRAHLTASLARMLEAHARDRERR